jgi:SAM-dependent methyltransferase
MNARTHAQSLAKSYLAQGDPTGWFDALYIQAHGDEGKIPWADLKPNPNLVSWLERKSAKWNRSLIVGCGLGDDAEELARRGCRVTAFDISKTAVDWCRRRFPNSPVDYHAADLLNPPSDWKNAFDFVFECYTLQVLPPGMRRAAADRLAEFVAPGGKLLIVCRGREETDPEGGMPWPLTRVELQRLMASSDLGEAVFEDYFDQETPPARRFRVEYVHPDFLANSANITA